MRHALVCPNCRHPLTALDARAVDYFCQACFTSLAIVTPELCYYQLGQGSGRLRRCSLSSIQESA